MAGCCRSWIIPLPLPIHWLHPFPSPLSIDSLIPNNTNIFPFCQVVWPMFCPYHCLYPCTSYSPRVRSQKYSPPYPRVNPTNLLSTLHFHLIKGFLWHFRHLFLIFCPSLLSSHSRSTWSASCAFFFFFLNFALWFLE